MHGWQAQSANSENESLPSVQGTIHRTLRKIARYQDCSISGTSRTDAGVHAQGQIGRIKLPVDLDPGTLCRGMNSMLPSNIRILECVRCPPEFNPKVGATSKEYHYYFSSEPVANPLISDIVAHVPGPLDLDRLERATAVFVGEHDFYSFCRRSTNAATTVREVYSIDLVRPEPHQLMGSVSTLRVVGNGFLKHGVRYLVSTLFEMARGTLSVAEVAAHLATQNDTKLCPKAPAHGLHLVEIFGL